MDAMEFLDLVERHAREHPEAEALVTSDGARMGYGELWSASGGVAAMLAREAARDGRPAHEPVMVYGHKSPLMLACLLACLRSGRPYVPCDCHSVPPARVRAIAAQLGSPVLLAVEPLPPEALADGEGRALAAYVWDAEKVARAAALSEWPDAGLAVSGDELAYVLFTSGSTGAPKGVEVTAACVDRFMPWCVSIMGPGVAAGAPRRFLDQAPFSFDLSVFELVGALATGGALFSLAHATQSSMRDQLAALGASGVYVWVSTPSFAEMCLADPSFSASLMPRVETFLFCGETLTNACARRLQERFPAARVVNSYGPTESTVAVSAVEVTPSMAAAPDPLPVGAPRPGTRIRVVDERGADVATGALGEVVIEGDTVALGYLGQPALTAARFGSATLGGRPVRTYRTGDEGWLDEGGMLHYHGRIDLQVKLNGYRIELGDVESHLAQVPGVKAAAVVAATRDGRADHLVAHVVWEGERPSSDFELARDVKARLRSSLPHYMIPRRIVFDDALPVTPNGKVDRHALVEELPRRGARGRRGVGGGAA